MGKYFLHNIDHDAAVLDADNASRWIFPGDFCSPLLSGQLVKSLYWLD